MIKLKRENVVEKDKLKLFLFFFIGVILYNFIVVNDFSFFTADEITYTYHIVDFSIGLCTKLLPGAIFTFLFEDVMPWHVTLVETILLFVVFAVLSYFVAELLVRQEKSENFRAIMIFSVFLFTGPVTLSAFTNELGMLDVYWIYFSLLFFFFLSKKYLYIFIPLVFILSASVHFSSMISYILLFSVIILFRISQKRNGRILLVFVFIASVAMTFAMMVWLLKNESDNLNFTIDEFHNYLDSRFKMDGSTYYIYYDYSLYKVPYVDNFPFKTMSDDLLISGESKLPAFLVALINAFWQQIHIVYMSYSELPDMYFNLLYLIILISPVIVFFVKFWLSKIRSKDKNIIKKFCYFLMLVQFPVTAVSGCLCSPDFTRWFTHTILIQFAFVLYVLFTEKDNSIEWISNYLSKFKEKTVLLYSAIYSISFFAIY